MTEDEFREWQQNRGYKPKRTSYGSIAGAAPTCCQPARPSGVSAADMDKAEQRDPEAFDRLQKRVAKFTAAKVMEERGFPGAEIVLPEDRKRRNKYGNRKVEIDGLKFDSQHEANVYLDLMARVRAGDLKCVMRQVKFDLGGGYHATKESRYQYIADFVTIDRYDKVEVIDAKSEITRQNRTYLNKKKQMLAEWGLEIREV